jgi:hypothetical protein
VCIMLCGGRSGISMGCTTLIIVGTGPVGKPVPPVRAFMRHAFRGKAYELQMLSATMEVLYFETTGLRLKIH